MRRVAATICLVGLMGIAQITMAQSPVTISVNTASKGNIIPPDFVGLSFETGSELYDNAGVSGYLFDNAGTATNNQIIDLFQQMGIRDLRLGGGSVDASGVAIPSDADIDAVFSFASAADVNVIYSLRLLSTDESEELSNQATDSLRAQYIMQHYSSQLKGLAIGNEPDWNSPYHTTDPETPNYSGYLTEWKEFATDISGGASGIKYVGPDMGSNYPVVNNPPLSDLLNATNTSVSGVDWSTQFAKDITGWTFPNSSSFGFVTFHNYPGESCSGLTPQEMIDAMLSSHFVDSDYPALYNAAGAPVLPSGVSYRETEANPFTGYVVGGSNCFGTALWALDFMHWWAAANTITGNTNYTKACIGVNFHNKEWGENDVIYQVSSGDYKVNPMGYGIKAFGLGGHGYVESDSITSNVDGVNLTSYAVGDAQDSYVTIINKEHGSGSPQSAAVTIVPEGFPAVSAQWMALTEGATGGASDTTALLGGASISNGSQQLGKWTELSLNSSGQPTFTLPYTEAAVVHIRAASGYVGPTQINQNGALQIFGIDGTGNVWRDQQKNGNYSSDSSNWAGWIDIGGGVTAGSSPAVVKQLDNTLAMFIPGATPTTDVYFKYQTSPGGGFSSWIDLGGAGITSLQAAKNPDGSLQVFGLDGSGNLWRDTQNAPNGSWSGWSEVSGETLEPGFVVVPNGDGRLIVIGVSTASSHDVYNTWQQDPGGSFGGWTNMGNMGGASTDYVLRAARDLDGKVELFGIGYNGDVWHDWQPASGGWHGWADLGTMQIQPGFVVGQNKDGRLVLLGVDAASPYHVFNIWQSKVNVDSAWTGWTDMGLPGGVTLNPRLMVGTTADFRMQLFAIGNDGNVWTDWQPTSGGWDGWSASGTDLGGPGLTWSSGKASGIGTYAGAHTSSGITEYSLADNYPNPFNPSTIISYQLPKASFVTLTIYDVLGQKIATLVDQQENPGAYDVNFNASKLPSGVYFYRLDAGSYTAVKKMMFVK